MVLRVYFISTTGRRDIRKGQIHVFSVLSSWKYEYEAIDVAAPENENERHFVIDAGKKSEDGKIILPQIFEEERCCGDYSDFLNAIEDEKLKLFLKQMKELEMDAMKQDKVERENEGRQSKNEDSKGKLNFFIPTQIQGK